MSTVQINLEVLIGFCEPNTDIRQYDGFSPRCQGCATVHSSPSLSFVGESYPSPQLGARSCFGEHVCFLALASSCAVVVLAVVVFFPPSLCVARESNCSLQPGARSCFREHVCVLVIARREDDR